MERGTQLYWPPELRRYGLPGYALDLPGHGKSGGRGLQSISAYARLCWSGLNLECTAYLAGHSMGSAIALLSP